MLSAACGTYHTSILLAKVIGLDRRHGKSARTAKHDTRSTKIARLTNLTIFNPLQQYVLEYVHIKNTQNNKDLDTLHYLYIVFLEIFRRCCVICCCLARRVDVPSPYEGFG
jgi:hypothetical protein